MGIDGEGPGWLGKALSFVAGAVLLVLVFTLSLLLFAGLVAGGALVWGYLWWRTRELRRELQRQMGEQRGEQRDEQREDEQRDEQPLGGRVIEGEVIRDHGFEKAEDRDGRS